MIEFAFSFYSNNEELYNEDTNEKCLLSYRTNVGKILVVQLQKH